MYSPVARNSVALLKLESSGELLVIRGVTAGDKHVFEGMKGNQWRPNQLTAENVHNISNYSRSNNAFNRIAVQEHASKITALPIHLLFFEESAPTNIPFPDA
jgi:hypothetical protein